MIWKSENLSDLGNDVSNLTDIGQGEGLKYNDKKSKFV